MSLSDQITFVVPPSEIKEIAGHTSASATWQYFSSGLRVWLVQTYMYLKEVGLNVELDSRVPRAGIMVYSAEFNPTTIPRNVTTVAVRYDRAPQFEADFEIVQNGWFADNARCFFVPHWPQPNLKPRDPSRGSSIETIAYKGIAANLHDDFKSDKWLRFLTGIGVEWKADYNNASNWMWNDYSSVDLILAVRPGLSKGYYHKPASKLTNAWAAQVPAILGPEYSYRELKRSVLDYLEVVSMEEAAETITLLIENPGQYDAMIQNGMKREREFSTSAICSRWIELLTWTIPRRVGRNTYKVRRIVPKGYRVQSRRIHSRMRSLRKRLSLRYTSRPMA